MDESASSVLKAARRQAGLSQPELARRAGVAQSVISAYESGRREPSLKMLDKLVAATGHHLGVIVVASEQPVRGLPDTPVGRRVRHRRRAIIDRARRVGATNVRLFGSVARGDDREGSDVDLLVDLEPDVGLVRLAGLRRELSELLDVDVDVVPATSLKPGIRARVLADAIPL